MSITEKIMWTAVVFWLISMIAIQLLPSVDKMKKEYGKAGLYIVGIAGLTCLISAVTGFVCSIYQLRRAGPDAHSMKQ